MKNSEHNKMSETSVTQIAIPAASDIFPELACQYTVQDLLAVVSRGLEEYKKKTDIERREFKSCSDIDPICRVTISKRFSEKVIDAAAAEFIRRGFYVRTAWIWNEYAIPRHWYRSFQLKAEPFRSPNGGSVFDCLIAGHPPEYTYYRRPANHVPYSLQLMPV